MQQYTHGAIYAWSHICMEPYTHGAVYAWSCICMEPYMHGDFYAWSHILVAPAHSPCSQLAPWAYLGPWNYHGALESLQLTSLAPSLLPSLPACSPYSLSIPGSLGPPWSLRKLASHSPCSQLAALAPWAYLGPWNFPGALESLQLTSLAPSLLPSLPACSPYSLSIPGPLGPPWSLRKSPAHSPCSLSIPGSLEFSWGLRKPPAHSPYFQLAPLTSSLLPLPPQHL